MGRLPCQPVELSKVATSAGTTIYKSREQVAPWLLDGRGLFLRAQVGGNSLGAALERKETVVLTPTQCMAAHTAIQSIHIRQTSITCSKVRLKLGRQILKCRNNNHAGNYTFRPGLNLLAIT